MLKKILQAQRVLVLLLILLFVSTIWIYIQFDKTIKYTSKNIENMELRNMSRIARAIGDQIKLNINNNIYKELKYDKKLRRKLNKILSMYVNDEMKYVYVIYKDKKGAYRYLLDGSKSSKEKGMFDQIFVPVSKIWDVCLKTKGDIFTMQRNINSLWITYLHPIIINNKMQAILALDISILTDKKIEQILAPLKIYLRYLIGFVFMVVFITIFQFYLFIRERKMSRVDILTRLYNRTYLKEKKNSIDLNKVAVAMADIDHFKNVNDTFGHDIGDIVLNNIANKLVAHTRAEDIVIRYGGEEFLIIFRKKDYDKDIENIIKVAERLQRQVSENKVRVGNVNIKVTISIGLDPYTYKRKSLDESISIADLMLYEAKKKGRNRIEVAKD